MPKNTRNSNGTAINRSHFSKEVEIQIQYDWENTPLTATDIARKYNTTKSTIIGIAARRYWTSFNVAKGGEPKTTTFARLAKLHSNMDELNEVSRTLAEERKPDQVNQVPVKEGTGRDRTALDEQRGSARTNRRPVRSLGLESNQTDREKVLASLQRGGRSNLRSIEGVLDSTTPEPAKVSGLNEDGTAAGCVPGLDVVKHKGRSLEDQRLGSQMTPNVGVRRSAASKLSASRDYNRALDGQSNVAVSDKTLAPSSKSVLLSTSDVDFANALRGRSFRGRSF